MMDTTSLPVKETATTGIVTAPAPTPADHSNMNATIDLTDDEMAEIQKMLDIPEGEVFWESNDILLKQMIRWVRNK